MPPAAQQLGGALLERVLATLDARALAAAEAACMEWCVRSAISTIAQAASPPPTPGCCMLH
jgi:hypothetical protein